MSKLKLILEVSGDDPRRARIGRHVYQMLKDEFGTLPFELDVCEFDSSGGDQGSATYNNEGKRL